MSREAMQQALEALKGYEQSILKFGLNFGHGYAAIAACEAALAEQPAAPVPTSFEDWWFKESTLDALEKNLTVEQECRLVWDAAIAAAIPAGYCVVPVEKLEFLRFVQRALESNDAPQADKDAAAQMVRDLRQSLAARPGGEG